MKVAILNFEGAVASAVAGPYDMFSKVKMIAESMNIKTKAFFEVDIVSSKGLASGEPFNMEGNINLSTKKIYDLVMVPAMHMDRIGETLQKESDMISWVRKQYEKGASIASMCTGAFLVASTGLLDGKRTTTHWMGSPFFRQLFPKVKLEDDKIIIDEGRFYSSGETLAFNSLVISVKVILPF